MHTYSIFHKKGVLMLASNELTSVNLASFYDARAYLRERRSLCRGFSLGDKIDDQVGFSVPGRIHAFTEVSALEKSGREGEEGWRGKGKDSD